MVVVAAAGTLILLTVASSALPGSAVVKADVQGLPHSWGMASSAVVVTLAVASLASLANMLRAVERERVFASDMTRHFRRFALFYLLSVVADLAIPPLLQSFSWLARTSGSVVFSIDDRRILDLVIGALLFFIARLFDEAIRFEEDSRAIV